MKEFIQRAKAFINENPQRKKILLIILVLAIIPFTVIAALTVQNLRQHAAVDETFGASARIFDRNGEEILNSISDPNVFISIYIDRAFWSRWAIPDQPSASNGLVKNVYAVTPDPNNDCSNAAGLCRFNSCLAGETLKSSPECQSVDKRLVCCIASSATPTPTPTAPTPTPTNTPTPTPTPTSANKTCTSGNTRCGMDNNLEACQTNNLLQLGWVNLGSCAQFGKCVQVSSTEAKCQTTSSSNPIPTPTPTPTIVSPTTTVTTITSTSTPTPTPTKHILRAVYIENTDGDTGGSAPIKIVVKSRADITKIPWRLNDLPPGQLQSYRRVQITLIGDEIAVPISTHTLLTNYPTPTPYPNASKNLDLNNDGLVNCKDTRILISQYGQKGTSLSADLNHDGIIDGTDLNTILRNYTPGDTTVCPK